VFEERGFEAATLEEIARRAGVAVGGFYLHFRSKRQVLLVLMDRLLGEMDALAVVEVPAGAERAVATGLVHVGLRVDRAYAGAYRAWREASAGDPELARLDAVIDEWSAERMAGLLRLLLKSPDARTEVDPDTTAWILSSLFWRLTEARLDHLEAVEAALAHLVESTLFRDEPPSPET